jgi:prolyl oligopeptidase
MSLDNSSGIGRNIAAWVLLATSLRAFSLVASTHDVATPRVPVTTTYHDQQVTDDYQWLENGASPEVREWTARQNARTQSYFERSRLRDSLADDLEELYEDAGASYFQAQARGHHLFVMRYRPPAQQAALLMFTGITNLERHVTLFDANLIETNGATSLDWFIASPDGERVAVCLSRLGSEKGSLKFLETTNRRAVTDVIPYVQSATAGGSAVWNTNGTGIFYTRYPHPGERPEADLNFYQQVWYHRLGTPVAEDTYELGKELPRIAEIELEASHEGGFIIAAVANGDGGEFAHWLRSPAGGWRQITRFEDGIKAAHFGRDNMLYLLSRKGTPRGQILRVPRDAPDLAQAHLFLAQGSNVIAALTSARTGLFVKDLVGGPSQVRFIDYQARAERLLPLKPVSAVSEMEVWQEDQLLMRVANYTEPFAYYQFKPSTNKLTKTILAGSSPVEFGDVEVVREVATSKDGTQIPMNILRRKGLQLDGNAPTLLYGYGGYGVSLEPGFDFTRRLWFDAGGVLVIANLRGGGEFGETWHQAGCLTNKQNVFDDFIACAEWLVAHRYTNPRRLAIEGRSNGGLLMGAGLTQRPDLFRAVSAEVGIHDMLRVELDPNGAFNVTEFGTVKDRAQFEALYAYSPFHHVKEGVKYPAVLLTTAEQDGRVNPYHSRKMAARLQDATRSDYPVLLRVSSGAGHGMGSALKERIAERADILAFLMNELEMDRSRWVCSTAVERGPWSGAITPNSVVIKAKLAKPEPVVWLQLSPNRALNQSKFFKPIAPTTNEERIAQWSIAGLKPDTTYYYAIRTDGRPDLEKRGQFRTFTDGASSFNFAYASCARSGSTNGVFDTIRTLQPAFFMNIGDFHYRDISSNSEKRFRRAYDLVLYSSTQAQLYRNIPFVYIWDDHDFGGNSADRRVASRPAARHVYDEYVPHYPLPFSGTQDPICFAFTLGRARFIVTDLRSQRDPTRMPDNEKKSMMGAPQKAWFKRELLDANSKYPLIFWVSTLPWIGEVTTNYYPLGTNQTGYLTDSTLGKPPERRKGRYPYNVDDWSAYATERHELAEFFQSHQIRGLCILHGDSHMLAADDGSHSDYSSNGQGPRIPVMCAAPLDQSPSHKGGPYSQGIYHTSSGEGCFGLVTVNDSGSQIEVIYSGRNLRNEEKVSLRFTVDASAKKPGK